MTAAEGIDGAYWKLGLSGLHLVKAMDTWASASDRLGERGRRDTRGDLWRVYGRLQAAFEDAWGLMEALSGLSGGGAD